MRIDVCLATDDNYAKYCATTMYSVVKNAAKGDDVLFHIVHGGISAENIEKISKIGNVKFYKVNDADFASYVRKTKLTWATPTLYRLKLPSILSDDVKKVIYLDCDIIVRSSLRELFSTDIKNYTLAAVPDVSHKAHLVRLGLADGDGKFYFNAGMVFLNLEKMRKENTEDALFTFLQDNWQNLMFSDQDVLNSVLFDKALELPAKFNYIPLSCYHNKKLRSSLPKDAVIVHFAGTKPWGTGFYNPFECEFWRNYRSSNFLDRSTFWSLWRNYRKSRGKFARIFLYLKIYPLAPFRKARHQELFDVVFG